MKQRKRSRSRSRGRSKSSSSSGSGSSGSSSSSSGSGSSSGSSGSSSSSRSLSSAEQLMKMLEEQEGVPWGERRFNRKKRDSQSDDDSFQSYVKNYPFGPGVACMETFCKEGEDWKKCYRRNARKMHPDKGGSTLKVDNFNLNISDLNMCKTFITTGKLPDDDITESFEEELSDKMKRLLKKYQRRQMGRKEERALRKELKLYAGGLHQGVSLYKGKRNKKRKRGTSSSSSSSSSSGSSSTSSSSGSSGSQQLFDSDELKILEPRMFFKTMSIASPKRKKPRRSRSRRRRSRSRRRRSRSRRRRSRSRRRRKSRRRSTRTRSY